MLQQIAARTHAWVQPDGTWWLNNAGVAGDDGVLVIDTCAAAARTRRLPDVTGADGLTVHAGGRRVELRHPGGPARGVSPLKAARGADLGPFASWPDAERIVLNLHRVYADESDHDVDLAGALTDATTWLGGPMHTAVNE